MLWRRPARLGCQLRAVVLAAGVDSRLVKPQMFLPGMRSRIAIEQTASRPGP